jgi:hypothetical protein
VLCTACLYYNSFSWIIFSVNEKKGFWRGIVERTSSADTRRRIPLLLFVIVFIILLFIPHISLIKGQIGKDYLISDAYITQYVTSISLNYGEPILVWIDVKADLPTDIWVFIKQPISEYVPLQKELCEGLNIFWFIPAEVGLYEIKISTLEGIANLDFLRFSLYVTSPLIFSIAAILAFIIIHFSFRWIFQL